MDNEVEGDEGKLAALISRPCYEAFVESSNGFDAKSEVSSTTNSINPSSTTSLNKEMQNNVDMEKSDEEKPNSSTDLSKLSGDLENANNGDGGDSDQAVIDNTNGENDKLLATTPVSQKFLLRSSTPLRRELVALNRSLKESKILKEYCKEMETANIRKLRPISAKVQNLNIRNTNRRLSNDSHYDDTQNFQEPPLTASSANLNQKSLNDTFSLDSSDVRQHFTMSREPSPTNSIRSTRSIYEISGYSRTYLSEDDQNSSYSQFSNLKGRPRKNKVNNSSITYSKAKKMSKNDAKRTNMRSQNAEFVQKQKIFLKKMKNIDHDAEEIETSDIDDTAQSVGTIEDISLNEGSFLEIANDSSLEARLSNVWQTPPKSGSDSFCFKCHDTINVIACSRCVRSFHATCVKISYFTTVGNAWICPECSTIDSILNGARRSRRNDYSPDFLCQLLSFAIQRLKGIKGVYALPVIYPAKYFVNPISLASIQEKNDKKLYRCAEEFFNDCKWVLHNIHIFCTGVSTNSKWLLSAKALVKACRQETYEIETCPECYLNANTRSDWFVDVCSYPHLLLWAKLKGFPFWPCKVMGQAHSSQHVNVRFFGKHDRSVVSVKDCFLFCEKDPNAQTSKRSLRELAESLEEADQHIEKIKAKIGNFCYAPFKTPYDPSNEILQLESMMPGVTEFIKKQKESTPKPPLTFKIVKTADNNLSYIKKDSAIESGNESDPSSLSQKKKRETDYEVVTKVDDETKVTSVILKRKSPTTPSAEIAEHNKTEELTVPPIKVTKCHDGEKSIVSAEITSINGGTSFVIKRKHADIDNSSSSNDKSKIKIQKIDSNTRKSNTSNSTENKEPTTQSVVEQWVKNKQGVTIKKIYKDSEKTQNKSEESSSVNINEKSKDLEKMEIKDNVQQKVNKKNDTPAAVAVPVVVPVVMTSKVNNSISKKSSSNQEDKTQTHSISIISPSISSVPLNSPSPIEVPGETRKSSSASTEDALTEKETSKRKKSAGFDKSVAEVIPMIEIKQEPSGDLPKEAPEAAATAAEPAAEPATAPRTATPPETEPGAAQLLAEEEASSVTSPASESLKNAPTSISENTVTYLPAPANRVPHLPIVIKEEVLSDDDLDKNSQMPSQQTHVTIAQNSSHQEDSGKKSNKSSLVSSEVRVVGETTIQKIGNKNNTPTLATNAAASTATSQNHTTHTSVPNKRQSPRGIPYGPLPANVSINNYNQNSVVASSNSHTTPVTIIPMATIPINNIQQQQQIPRQNQPLQPAQTKQQQQRAKRAGPATSAASALISISTSTSASISITSSSTASAQGGANNSFASQTLSSSINNQDVVATLLPQRGIAATTLTSATSTNKRSLLKSGSMVSIPVDVVSTACNIALVPIPPLTAVSKTSLNNSITTNANNANSIVTTTSFINKPTTSVIKVLPTTPPPLVGLSSGISSNATTNVSSIPIIPSDSPSIVTTNVPLVSLVSSQNLITSIASNANVNIPLVSTSTASAPPSYTTSLPENSTSVPLTTSETVTPNHLANSLTPAFAAAVSDIICNKPLPTLIPCPANRPLLGDGNTVFHSQAGPVSRLLAANAHKLTDFFISTITNTISDIALSPDPANLQGKITSLELEIERLKHSHEQEVTQLRHNADVMLTEMRKSMENEKSRIISEIRKQCEVERLRAVEETKKKQWCVTCGAEAQFYCCWNTSYCDYPCQQLDWGTHSKTCSQTNSTNNEANNVHQQAQLATKQLSNTSNVLATINNPTSSSSTSSTMHNQNYHHHKVTTIGSNNTGGVPTGGTSTTTSRKEKNKSQMNMSNNGGTTGNTITAMVSLSSTTLGTTAGEVLKLPNNTYLRPVSAQQQQTVANPAISVANTNVLSRNPSQFNAIPLQRFNVPVAVNSVSPISLVQRSQHNWEFRNTIPIGVVNTPITSPITVVHAHPVGSQIPSTQQQSHQQPQQQHQRLNNAASNTPPLSVVSHTKLSARQQRLANANQYNGR